MNLLDHNEQYKGLEGNKISQRVLSIAKRDTFITILFLIFTFEFIVN